MYTHTHTHTHTDTHTHTHTHTHMQTHMQTHEQTHKHTCTHTNTYLTISLQYCRMRERSLYPEIPPHPMTLLNLNRDLLLLLSEFTFTACLCWVSNLEGSMWRWNVSELSHETILKHLIGHFLVGSGSNSNVCWWTRGSSSNLTEDN